MQERRTKQLLICFSIMLLFTVVSLFSKASHLGFLGNLGLLTIGTLCTTVGVMIGDAFRRFVKPDMLFASSATDMFRQKIFWLFGPQFIGWIGGLMMAVNLLRNFGVPL